MNTEWFKDGELDRALHLLEDRYLGSSNFVRMMINSPMYASFCDANKKDVSEQTIILMAISIIAKEYGITMSYQLEDWIAHFKKAILQHLLSEMEK